MSPSTHLKVVHGDITTLKVDAIVNAAFEEILTPALRRAFDGKAASIRATSATSATVVNSPSTVSFSMTFLMTSCSEMPSSFACSGICLSTSGVRTKPGQITFARTPCSAPSFATTFARPTRPCLAVT